MALAHDFRHRLQKIDEEILDLLGQRVLLCEKALEEDEEALSPEMKADVLAEWEGAADERGLNMTIVGNICKLAQRLTPTTED